MMDIQIRDLTVTRGPRTTRPGSSCHRPRLRAGSLAQAATLI